MHMSNSARQHRAGLHGGTGVKTRRGIPQAQLLTAVFLASVLVVAGGFVSLLLYPRARVEPRDIDETRHGTGSGRKELDRPSMETDSLFSLLEAQTDTDGRRLDLDDLRGQVLLIANVASQCGYTASNYAAFGTLTSRFFAKGLRVVAVPCGQFGNQEFQEDVEIRQFVRSTYDQSQMPMITLLRKMDDDIDTNPLFAWLRSHGDDASPISWNFNKWLVDRQGIVRQRYDSADHLEDLARDISLLL